MGPVVLPLATVTETPAEVPVLPAASRATADSVWAPLAAVVVSHVMAYGGVVTWTPRRTPSSVNWTPATPTLSVALADTVTRPLMVAPASGAVIAIVGGVVSASAVPLPVAIAELLPPFAVKLTVALAVAVVVGVKRTVTVWLAPTPPRVKGLPDTMLKGAEVDAAPETVPPPVFETVKTWSAKRPIVTLPKLTVPVGLTAKSDRATALATLEQALRLPAESTAVTATLYSAPVLSPESRKLVVWLGPGLDVGDAT